VKFAFVAKHRGIWPVRWICEALGVSRSGFHAWLTQRPSKRARTDGETGARVRASFLASDRTYGARRVWRDVLAEGIACGLHQIERLMRTQALRALPRPPAFVRPCAAVAAFKLKTEIANRPTLSVQHREERVLRPQHRFHQQASI